MAKRYVAKLFQNGRSQAVRLPKECRLPGREVAVTRQGRRLILEPLDAGWSEAFVARFFRRAADAKRLPERDQPPPQDRPELDDR